MKNNINIIRFISFFFVLILFNLVINIESSFGIVGHAFNSDITLNLDSESGNGCEIIITNDSQIKGIWGDSCNVYKISSDVRVKSGDTLIILPGTKILFEAETSLTIQENAKFIAVGNSIDSIIFRGIDPVFPWSGIQFEGSLSPEIKYCKFSDTGLDEDRLVLAALHFEEISDSFNELSNCSFQSNRNGAVYISNFNKREFKLSDIKIDDCQGIAISIDGGNFYDKLAFENIEINGVNENIALTGLDISDCGEIKCLEFKNIKISGCEDKKIDSKYRLDNEGSAIYVDRFIEIEKVKIDSLFLSRNEALTSVLFVHSNDSIIINKLNIQECEAKKGASNFLCRFLEINNSIFENCKPLNNDLEGGAILFDAIGNEKQNKAALSISNSGFFNNENKNRNGNAININNPDLGFDKIEINNTAFRNNKSVGSNKGSGGVFAVTALNIDTLMFKNCVFEDNIARDNGGAIYLNLSESADYNEICDNRFDNNIAGKSGGVISINAKDIGNFEFINDTINGNFATDDGGIINIVSDKLGLLNLCSNISEIDTFCFSKNGSGGFANIDVDIIKEVNIKENNNLNTWAKLDGGFINLAYVKSDIDSILINNNTGIYSRSIDGDGGFMKISGDTLLSFEFKSNEIIQLKAQNGGFISAEFEKAENFIGSDNIIDETDVSGNGGVLSLSVGELKNRFEFLRNNVKKINALGDGGLCFINANSVQKSINFNENKVDSIKSLGSGGVLFLGALNDSCKVGEYLEFKGNTINYSESKNLGGIIYSNANINDGIKIESNNISEVLTENSGAYYFNDFSNSDEPIKYIYVKNENENIEPVSNISKNGNGGVFWIESNRDINQLEITGNNFNKVESVEGSGGGFFIEAPTVLDLKIDSNNIEKAIAGKNGGFICLNTDAIHSTEILSNNVTDTSGAVGFGGFACFSKCDLVDTFMFENNTIDGLVYAQNGGILFIGDIDTTQIPLFKGLSIKNNVMRANSIVENNGGYFYLKGNVQEDFAFFGNEFYGSADVTNYGGILFWHNNYELTVPENNLPLESIFFQSNKIFKNNNRIKCKRGGFVYLDGVLNLNEIGFVDNSFDCDSIIYNEHEAEGSGGIVNIFGDNISIDNVLFKNNNYSGIISGKSDFSKGGILNFNANLNNNLTIMQDSLFGSASVGTGGAFNIENNSDAVITCKITQSSFKELNTHKSNGALINLKSQNIDTLQFKGNVLNTFNTEGSSAVFVNSSNIDRILSEENKFTGSSKNNGGVYNISSFDESTSKINSVSSVRDTFENCHSKDGSGGAFYFNVDEIDDIAIYSPYINEVTAKLNGGFLCLEDNTRLLDFKFNESENIKNVEAKSGHGGMFYFNNSVNSIKFITNKMENISAGKNGGVFYFNGKINIVHIYNSTIKNVFSGDNGGVVYFNGDKDSSEIEFKNNFVSNGPNSESSLNGGIMFCTNLKELHMSNNKDLSSINVKGLGGTLYADDIEEIYIDNNSYISNVAGLKGGAVYISQAQNLEIKNNKFTSNEAGESGGAIYVTNTKNIDSENNKFNSNVATKKGGAVFAQGTSANMSSDILIYNSAHDGGAIYFESVEGGIYDSKFEYNFLENKDQDGLELKGGALFVDISTSKLDIHDCSFGYHTLAEQGGAIYAKSGKLNFIRSSFFKNQARKKGSAVYLLKDAANSSFYNCLFDDNNNTTKPILKSVWDDEDRAVINAQIGVSNDSIKVVNCTFNKGNLFAIGLEKVTTTPTLGRCIIKNSIVFNFNDAGFVSVYDPGNLRKIDFCNLSRADVKLSGDSCIYGDPGFDTIVENCFILKEGSQCIDRGDTLELYNDLLETGCQKGTVRNDLGVSGGPFAMCDCTTPLAVNIKTPKEIGWENDADFGINLYPNPATHSINVQLGEFYGLDVFIEVFTITGVVLDNIVFKKPIQGEIKSIDLNGFQTGTYFLRIRNNKYTVAKQFVVM
ncbi:MAG: T9SS type A sorting domain-containing protein [Prolixibacteraceae bacterium]|jgi:predicted outer membrane repeat protein|nr:T9SS type A sorting domain-containing protein [Prolixibacteraceae bacterium]MBT6767266.1 T9SS type A sorting domain-containing protein [Prolixibacteraceae bacterium]MBT6999164.1 T9SS type A sorting domain-containing protein [Prolixibacteraceae bacterium]MBT7395977.1 T9SS type A sorting domain-containing protein [Prolixibacteraceae bacterium]